MQPLPLRLLEPQRSGCTDAPTIESFGTGVAIGGTGLGRTEWVGTPTDGVPGRWYDKICDGAPCVGDNRTWNGDSTWVEHAFLGVGGTGVRLMAGGQHAIISPRLTHVNKTIEDDRDPFSENGTAKNSHDWIVYPGCECSNGRLGL